MNKYLTISALFLIQIVSIGCKTAGTKAKYVQKPISIDSKLLIPWNEALQDLGTAQSPALYEFKLEGKNFWYLASQHSNRIDQPVFNYIDSVFKKSQTLLLLEVLSQI